MNVKILLLLVVIIGGLVLTKNPVKSRITDVLSQSNELSQQLEMGETVLHVRDLETMVNFYKDLVGLDVLAQTDTEVTLGFESDRVITLIASPTVALPPIGSSGLYHNAIVFESRAVLAQTLDRILSRNSYYFSGSSDHKVSEAFYFTDPEGNGLELYFDKDPSTWQWKNGQIMMGSSYIDPADYIEKYGMVSDTPAKKMGHVHLKVGNIEQAESFYVTALGLTITAKTPGALFVSDGKYHHHLGLNVWESQGSGPRKESLGLKSLEIFVADQKDIRRLEKRLKEQSIEYIAEESSLTVNDPWNNQIIVKVKSS